MGVYDIGSPGFLIYLKVDPYVILNFFQKENYKVMWLGWQKTTQ